MQSMSGRGVKYCPAPDFFSAAFFSKSPLRPLPDLRTKTPRRTSGRGVSLASGGGQARAPVGNLQHAARVLVKSRRNSQLSAPVAEMRHGDLGGSGGGQYREPVCVGVKPRWARTSLFFQPEPLAELGRVKLPIAESEAQHIGLDRRDRQNYAIVGIHAGLRLVRHDLVENFPFRPNTPRQRRRRRQQSRSASLSIFEPRVRRHVIFGQVGVICGRACRVPITV